MNFDEYINATRTISNRTPNSHLYIPHYQVIKEAFGFGVSLPVLKIVYSIQKSTEIVELDDGLFLIYDQYLGQSMNMFNRILLNSTDRFDTVMYLYKLLAEEFATRGQSIPAVIFALSYQDFKRQQDSFKHDKDVFQRGIFTSCQELFIIAHELAHWVIDKPFNFLTILDIMNINEAPKSRYANLIKTIGNYFGINNIIYQVLDDPTTLADGHPIKTQLEGLELSSTIKDECCCDIIATIIVISILRKMTPEQYQDDISIAVAMGLRNLRVIGFIKDMCSGALMSPELHLTEAIDPKVITDYMTRTSNIRTFLSLNSSQLGIRDDTKWREKLVNLAEHYEFIIDDPLYEAAGGATSMTLREMKEKFPKSKMSDVLTAQDIGEITGFYE